MADQARIDSVKTQISECDTFLSKDLIQRPAWGEVNFKPAELDLKRTKDIVAHLSILPLEYLPDGVCDKTVQTLTNVRGTL